MLLQCKVLMLFISLVQWFAALLTNVFTDHCPMAMSHSLFEKVFGETSSYKDWINL